MNPLHAYEIKTPACRYTLTLYRLDDGRYLAEYCAHNPQPGPLTRVGDLQPPPSMLTDHHEYYTKTLLKNCVAEIERESGPVQAINEIPITHSAPGHECADTAPV
jgi:hypothetical protein